MQYFSPILGKKTTLYSGKILRTKSKIKDKNQNYISKCKNGLCLTFALTPVGHCEEAVCQRTTKQSHSYQLSAFSPRPTPLTADGCFEIATPSARNDRKRRRSPDEVVDGAAGDNLAAEREDNVGKVETITLGGQVYLCRGISWIDYVVVPLNIEGINVHTGDLQPG